MNGAFDMKLKYPVQERLLDLGRSRIVPEGTMILMGFVGKAPSCACAPACGMTLASARPTAPVKICLRIVMVFSSRFRPELDRP